MTGGDEATVSMTSKIGLNSLRRVSILFDDDLYELACFLVKVCHAKDAVAHQERARVRSRPTVHGVANWYAMLTNVKLSVIEGVLKRHGFELGTIVEFDDDLNQP